METSLQSSKSVTAQDAVLDLVSITRNQEDTEQFDKVFGEASQKLDQDRQKTEEEEDEKKVKKQHIETKVVGCDLPGITTGPESAEKGKQGKVRASGPSVDDPAQAEKKIELQRRQKN